VVTRLTCRNIALPEGEQGTPHFPADRPALLAAGDVPLGPRVSRSCRRHRRGTLEERRRSTTPAAMACDRCLLASLRGLHAPSLLGTRVQALAVSDRLPPEERAGRTSRPRRSRAGAAEAWAGSGGSGVQAPDVYRHAPGAGARGRRHPPPERPARRLSGPGGSGPRRPAARGARWPRALASDGRERSTRRPDTPGLLPGSSAGPGRPQAGGTATAA
jgi:hypothetical protein